MAGRPLQGLYSGTRGLDLGPLKNRQDERFRREQFAEDIRRALAGEKIASSELMLRSEADQARQATDMKRQALEQRMGEQRMALEQQKLQQDLMLEQSKQQQDERKFLAATSSDLPPWRKQLEQFKAIIAGKQQGVNLRIDPQTGQLEIVPPAPKATPAAGGGTEDDSGGSFWDFLKSPAEKINEGTREMAGGELPQGSVEQTKAEAEAARKLLEGAARKQREAADEAVKDMSRAELDAEWAKLIRKENPTTADEAMIRALAAEIVRRGLK